MNVSQAGAATPAPSPSQNEATSAFYAAQQASSTPAVNPGSPLATSVNSPSVAPNNGLGPTQNQGATFMPAEQEMPIPMEQIEQIFRPREGDRLYWHQVKNALIMMSQNRDRFSEDLRYLCQGAFHEFRVDITANIASNPPRPLTAGQLDNLLTTLVNTANGIISPSAPAISWMLVSRLSCCYGMKRGTFLCLEVDSVRTALVHLGKSSVGTCSYKL